MKPLLENCPALAILLRGHSQIAEDDAKNALAAQLKLAADHLEYAHAIAISLEPASDHPVVRVQITRPNHAQQLRAYVSRAMRLMPKDTDNVQMHIWLQELANQIDAVQS